MFIDCSKLPDPLNPTVDDVFTSPGAAHTVVVTMSPYRCDDGNSERYYIRAVRDGTPIAFDADAFVGLYVSLGLRPWGRLDRSAATRPTITHDPELVDQRLAAFGPHLRALREQYGLSMGDLARALGCPPARLSQLELAEPDPVREGAGVREDEGRAALAELLAETASDAFVNITDADTRDPGPRHRLIELSAVGRAQRREAFKDYVWPAMAGMLTTEPARAAMSTIHNATAKPPEGTSVYEVPLRALTRVVDTRGMYYRLEVYEAPPPDMENGELVRDLGGIIDPAGLGGRWLPTNDEQFARDAARERWPGVEATWIRRAEGSPQHDLQTSNESVMVENYWQVVALPDLRDNVAKQTARAGLAHLLTTELLKIPAHLSSVDPQEFQGVIEGHLASDEAQRLIRLHG